MGIAMVEGGDLAGAPTLKRDSAGGPMRLTSRS
jgi:hypothetical protein